MESTLRVDSSDQIQIRIFEIHNLSVFLGGNRCRTCMTFLLNLCWWRLINFEPLVTYHSMFLSIQIIGKQLLNHYLSCFLYTYMQCLFTPVYFLRNYKKKKKKFIGSSFKLLQFYYLKECILFVKRLCFKPKYCIHLVYSLVA